ncbi:MAG: oxygen-independent coproporphyrinogen III oxidase [Chloroflexaceae bacterium]|nr:oxygen-independent coproporphyrinogen III oxidase [Chloroflexaceae bacterium]
MIAISNDFLDRYNRAGPRYTSYPTVPYWDNAFGEAEYRQALQTLSQRNDDALSVYVHLPFCAQRCHYCGCNATVTTHESVVDAYLDRVEREIDIVMDVVGGTRHAVQLHWGGGTPNFLTNAQMQRMYGILERHFTIDPRAEVAIEIDPRIASREQIQFIRSLGFNRVSLGIQDFDVMVQEAIGRIQPEALTREIYNTCRECGFDSVNVDLVYGLPGQTRVTFERTLHNIIELSPDRIACFSYAHLPNARANQRRVDVTFMPDHYEKFHLFQMAIDGFINAGYDWIGMDHFARHDDEMAVAARECRLHRNFMGYTIRPATDQIAFGMSSIGDMAHCFVQNDAKLGNYQKAIDEGRLPIVRGMRLSDDDMLRRRVITHMMCNLELPYNLTIADFGASVPELLPDELERVQPYIEEGFLDVEPDRLVVTTLGRFFIRNVCMEFDAYLGQQTDRPLFSKTI